MKKRIPKKHGISFEEAQAILKIHSPHSRDFSRELGGWALCVLRGFCALMTKKCYPQKMPSGNIFHTDGVTIFGKEAAA